MVYSLQEIVSATEKQRHDIEYAMDEGKGWHPDLASIYTGHKRSVEREIRETLRKISLSELLLKAGSGDTTGIMGAYYLVPDKLYDTLNMAAKEYDIAPKISSAVVTSWRGGSLDVDIPVDGSFRGVKSGSGGKLPSNVITTVQATINPTLLSANIRATNEMLEDQQYGILEWHVQNAGKAIGIQSTELALEVLHTGTDGDGTLNTETAGADETTCQQLMDSVDANAEDQFISDTVIITPESLSHSVWNLVVAAANTYTIPMPSVTTSPVADGFDFRVFNLDVLLCSSPQLHDPVDAEGAAFTACDTIVFDRKNALLTGRKRWLQIENYFEPFKDISGAVVTSRQDSITLYDDSICLLTET